MLRNHLSDAALMSLLVVLIAIHCCVQTACALLTENNSETDTSLRVAAFNIKHFGASKMKKKEAVSAIVNIIQRYDLIFIQETRDKSERSLKLLQSKLGKEDWRYTASVPIGRSRYYREQYVYFYRPGRVQLIRAKVYQDTNDVFEREPYVAQFKYQSPKAGGDVKFTVVGIHVDPHDVPAEIANLTHVISWAEREFPDSDGVLTMGDLNADCSYLNQAERLTTPLLNTPDQHTSLVPDSADTTVSHKTHCAYDRLILTRQGEGHVTPANVKVYDFEADLGLTFSTAWEVSDHKPIEFSLL